MYRNKWEQSVDSYVQALAQLTGVASHRTSPTAPEEPLDLPTDTTGRRTKTERRRGGRGRSGTLDKHQNRARKCEGPVVDDDDDDDDDDIADRSSHRTKAIKPLDPNSRLLRPTKAALRRIEETRKPKYSFMQEGEQYPRDNRPVPWVQGVDAVRGRLPKYSPAAYLHSEDKYKTEEERNIIIIDSECPPSKSTRPTRKWEGRSKHGQEQLSPHSAARTRRRQQVPATGVDSQAARTSLQRTAARAEALAREREDYESSHLAWMTDDDSDEWGWDSPGPVQPSSPMRPPRTTPKTSPLKLKETPSRPAGRATGDTVRTPAMPVPEGWSIAYADVESSFSQSPVVGHAASPSYRSSGHNDSYIDATISSPSQLDPSGTRMDYMRSRYTPRRTTPSSRSKSAYVNMEDSQSSDDGLDALYRQDTAAKSLANQSTLSVAEKSRIQDNALRRSHVVQQMLSVVKQRTQQKNTVHE
eukprot:TRINITY_DN286_c0_g1_i2.p1 TRINITY_DN286_c0_g1~~TRINITY_DN286_c0_g1_i2.p1  ORF type:complete len:471 (-),score=54.16 TRINITY_DN286_c0_g1_i2:1029-2441(-)